MPGTIQGSFGWDNAPFVNAMHEAEEVAKRGASNIQGKFASIFKRGPNMRAERAISGSLQAFASGDIASGIEAISSRMTGLGLIAGVAIGAGVAIFAKLKERIDASKEAHAALEEEMSKHPLSVVGKLSEEGMTQALQRREQLVTEARKKEEGARTGSSLWEGTKEFAAKIAGFDISKTVGKKRMNQVGLENKELAEGKQIMIDRANLAMELVSIENAKMGGHEREASITKILLDTEQKRAALQNSGITQKAFDIGDEALSRNAELMIQAENKRAAGKERNLAIEEKMADLIKKGLKPEDQKKVREGLELQDINKQLATETNPEARRNLQLQKTQKESELRSFAKPEEGQNPFQYGTLSARDFERSQESAKFNSQFAGFGMTQEQKDLKGPASPNAEVVTALQQVGEIIKSENAKYWGEGGK